MSNEEKIEAAVEDCISTLLEESEKDFPMNEFNASFLIRKAFEAGFDFANSESNRYEFLKNYFRRDFKECEKAQITEVLKVLDKHSVFNRQDFLKLWNDEYYSSGFDKKPRYEYNVDRMNEVRDYILSRYTKE